MDVNCFRCGRYGHYANECYAKTFAHGKRLLHEHEEEWITTKRKQYPFTKHSTRSGVYAVKLNDGKIYVGKSQDIDLRIAQHAQSKGSLTEIPIITKPIVNDFESWERNETLAQMKRHGIEKVRGWMYTSDVLTKSDITSIQEQMREKYDLCRICGKSGHFASDCKLDQNYSLEKEEDFSSDASNESEDELYSSELSEESSCESEL
jgi:hypothetical protein